MGKSWDVMLWAGIPKALEHNCYRVYASQFEGQS